MSKKDQELCERSYCRQPWTWLASGYRSVWPDDADALTAAETQWTMRVCDLHARVFLDLSRNETMRITVRSRGELQ